MKKFKYLSLTIVLAICFVNIANNSVAQQISAGITLIDHDDYKSGFSLNVQGDIISLNQKKSFAVIYDMQYKSVKAFDSYDVSQNFRSANIGVGVKYAYDRNRGEIALKGGVTLNSVPNFTTTQANSFTLYEFENASGSYFAV
jgi:hypothetical protein